MQLELAPERLDQRRERALVASLGPVEIDGHRVNDPRFVGTGLILPFEIIYLHAVRGFSTATAGLVLATVMGTAAVVTLPSGALLDRFSAKRILIAGNVVNALGYGGLAFVDRPWQGFVCSAVGGAGFGFATRTPGTRTVV